MVMGVEEKMRKNRIFTEFQLLNVEKITIKITPFCNSQYKK